MKANKRQVKKWIKALCGDIAAECILTREIDTADKAQKWNELVCRVANLQCEAVDHCSFAFDKARADFADHKAYRKELHTYRKAAFAKLLGDFNNEVNSIVKEMNALMPDSLREANKRG